MDQRHLRYFIAVAEELHFHRAAERLNLSQPSLSQQIRSLETELGVRLFHRTKRRVQITDAGQRFLDEARRLLSQMEHAVLATRQTGRGEVGLLSIGFVPATDYTIFPRLLPLFRKRQPAVQLVLRAMSTLTQIESIRSSGIDLGFVRPPIDDDLISTETLVREPLVVALPKGHPLCVRRDVPLRALQGERYIFFPRDVAPSYYDLVVSSCNRAGFSLHVTHQAEQYLTILSLIAGGLGLALVPASVKSIGMRGVIFRPLQAPVPHVELAMVYRRDNVSELLQSFLKSAREIMHKANT